jgi:hypothetical protein
VELDGFMRAYAHVQDHIGRPKAAGLERFPFSDFDANSAWLARCQGPPRHPPAGRSPLLTLPAPAAPVPILLGPNCP